MTLKFHAKALHTELTDDHIMLGFADDPVHTTEFVMMTRGLAAMPDIPQEISGGLYFEYADEAMSGFACVRSILLGEGRITIKIDRERCAEVPHAEFVITFDPAEPRAAELPRIVEMLLGNDARFLRSGGRA